MVGFRSTILLVIHFICFVPLFHLFLGEAAFFRVNNIIWHLILILLLDWYFLLWGILYHNLLRVNRVSFHIKYKNFASIIPFTTHVLSAVGLIYLISTYNINLTLKYFLKKIWTVIFQRNEYFFKDHFFLFTYIATSSGAIISPVDLSFHLVSFLNNAVMLKTESQLSFIWKYLFLSSFCGGFPFSVMSIFFFFLWLLLELCLWFSAISFYYT